MIHTILFLFYFLFSSQSFGYLLVSNVNPVQYQLEARIIVAGRGDELGTLFQLAAISKAEHYLKQDPKTQILIISVVENERKRSSELSQYQTRNFTNIRLIPGSLGADEFFKEVLKFKKIKSIDFFSHATIKFGMRLDRSENRLESVDNWSLIQDRMMDKSYVFLHGCNTGFELAPKVAKILKRPVMGSLTSTYFQRLTRDQVFLMSDDPKGRGRWAEPAVYRMMPDNKPYEGHWGHLSGGGLGFFKTFCSDLVIQDCFETMQTMLKEWVSVEKKYQNQVQDFLCSGRLDTELGKRCQKSLESGETFLNIFRGQSLKCDFMACEFELICPQFDDKCDLKVESIGEETMSKEYQAFMTRF